jgi:hypothetical protein
MQSGLQSNCQPHFPPPAGHARGDGLEAPERAARHTRGTGVAAGFFRFRTLEKLQRLVGDARELAEVEGRLLVELV